MERVIEEGCEQVNEHGLWCPGGHQRRGRIFSW
jgi:hypothetical protein